MEEIKVTEDITIDENNPLKSEESHEMILEGDEVNE